MTKTKTARFVRTTFAAKGTGNRCDLLDIFETAERNYRTKSYATFIGAALHERLWTYNSITVAVEAIER